MDELGKAYVELEDAQNKYTEALKEQYKATESLVDAEWEIYRGGSKKNLGANEKERTATIAKKTKGQRTRKFMADIAIIDARGMFENAKRKVEYEKIIRGVPF